MTWIPTYTYPICILLSPVMSTSTFFLLPPSSCCFCNQVCNQVLQFDSTLIAKGEIVWKSHRFLPLISDNQSCPALLLSPPHLCSARQIAFPWVTSLHLIDPASVLVCSEITIKITIDLWQCHTHCVYWVLVRLYLEYDVMWCDVTAAWGWRPLLQKQDSA